MTNHRDFFTPDEEGDVPVRAAAARDHADAGRRVPPGDRAASADLVLGRDRSQELRQPGRLRLRADHDLHRPAEDRAATAVCRRIAGTRQGHEAVGAQTIDDYVLDATGNATRRAATRAGGILEHASIVGETQADERYYAAKNRRVPKRIDSHLVIFDCITCDKCIPVCPNDANFVYQTAEARITYQDVESDPDGVVREWREKTFRSSESEQIANFADYCNHCGNCDTFCPEYDGPYLKKPSFFGSRQAFDEGAPHDGFLVEGKAGSLTLTGRIDGQPYRLQEQSGGAFVYTDGTVTLHFAEDGTISVDEAGQTPHRVDMGRYVALRTLLTGITDRTRVHAVNAQLLAGEESQEVSPKT